MTVIRKFIELRDSTGHKTGLTPTVRVYQVSDGVEVTPAPTASEIGATGVYTFTVDTTVQLIATIDGGDTLTSADDRYKRALIDPDESSVTVVQTPSGTYGVTLITQEAAGTRIPDVSIAVKNSSGQTIRTVKTDANGTVTIMLEDGAYTASPWKSMVNISDSDFTVAGASLNHTITGTPVTASTPNPGMQTVYDHVLRANGTGALNAKITARVLQLPEIVSNDIISHETVSATAAASGYFELSLIQGATVLVQIKDGTKLVYSKEITVTSDATKELRTY